MRRGVTAASYLYTLVPGYDGLKAHYKSIYGSLQSIFPLWEINNFCCLGVC